MVKEILILDFGSQYTHLIRAGLLRTGFGASIIAGDVKVKDWLKDHDRSTLGGLIFSGGAASVYDGKIKFDRQWLAVKVPVLGICYGYQLIASQTGKVEKAAAEFGQSTLHLTGRDPLFKGLPGSFNVWMSHFDGVTKLPKDFKVLARSDYSAVAVFRDSGRRVYGLLFHPEVYHTEFGSRILENFCQEICHLERQVPWSPQGFVREATAGIRARVGRSKAILGLSGGVDSLTTVALLRRSLPKKQLLAVYVDTGLMPEETLAEVQSFCKKRDISLQVVDAAKIFFKALEGIVDPTQKGKVIGKTFIDVFEKVGKEAKAEVFVQGTIWSDVVESGVTKFSSQIKPHHNVGGLPKRLKFRLLEPLRDLFKDQVRQVAGHLGLPDWVVKRKVFPGPGFAIRVGGVVTMEKVVLVRKATKIIEDVIYQSPVKDDIWMAFAILIEAPSLGVRGDKRTENKNALVVRIVESKNSMTATFSRKALPYLAQISKRMTDELEVGRVVYDITDKPPATIEWQ